MRKCWPSALVVLLGLLLAGCGGATGSILNADAGSYSGNYTVNGANAGTVSLTVGEFGTLSGNTTSTGGTVYTITGQMTDESGDMTVTLTAGTTVETFTGTSSYPTPTTYQVILTVTSATGSSQVWNLNVLSEGPRSRPR